MAATMVVEERGIATAALPSLQLSLADTVHPLVLSGQPALFLEHDQQILKLNGSAGALIARLIEGTTFDDLRSFAAGDRHMRSGQRDLERWLLDWSTKGIVSAALDWDDPTVAVGPVLTLEAGPELFALHFGAGRFGAALAAPYAHLAHHHADRAGRRVAVLPCDSIAAIMVEGRPTRIVPREQTASQVRFAIVQSILAHDGIVALHAACALRHGEAVLLCGSPGTGKSTLARALAQQGFQIAGDDIVLFDPASGEVCGVPLPLTLKQGSWDLLGSAVAAPEIRADGVSVRYAPLPRFAGSGRRPVGGIVKLDRTGAAKASFSAWSPLDCVQTLFGEAYAASGRSSIGVVRAMVDLAERSTTLRLAYDEADHAAGLMERRFGL
ncbi:AAA family ATPase [Novosphingobium lentum]|uniref:AAA family ATPase n=1 Tax=Novosphingobium lentum TaxID=145287 RepID=UPI00082BA0BC|nr:AAA family ATPase [Novosphingobium lentum]